MVTHPDARDRRWRQLMVAVIAILAAARIVLPNFGGQYFFGDEGRYERGIQLYHALLDGNLAGIRDIVGRPEHSLFAWVGAGVTSMQHLLSQLTAFDDWSQPMHVDFTIGLGASVLALFSALNVHLVHRVSRIGGASTDEALWSALLFAAANTPFYYARHLLPYPCALSAALAALVAGLGATGPRRAFVSGGLAGVAYHIYNGHWYIVPVLGLGVFWWWRTNSRPTGLMAAWMAGASVALSVPIAIGSLVAGKDYWTTMLAFGASVTHGAFREGWSLPWAFLWHSEGPAGLAIAVTLAGAILRARRSRDALPARVSLGLGMLAGSYLLLMLCSNALEVFVVYARTVLPLVAFLSLAAGWSLAAWTRNRPGWRAIGATAVILAGLFHFIPHFGFVFPREFEHDAMRLHGNPKRVLTFSGSIYIPLATPVTRPDLALINAQFVYPVRSHIPPPAGDALRHVTHPLEYAPFQYEGHRPGERSLLRKHGITMSLIHLAEPAAVPDDPPPAARYRNEDRPTGY